MGNFPLTRIALNLSLIVAVAIQPVAACAAVAVCSVRCSASDTRMCLGCGCCEVERANDHCCCCFSTADVEEKERFEPSCCSHDELTDAEVFDFQCSDLERSNTACKLSDAAESETTIQSLCLCEQNSQPLSDSSPTRPVNESRASLAMGFAGPVGADRDGRLSPALARDGTDIAELAHFSQIVLCIWRL